MRVTITFDSIGGEYVESMHVPRGSIIRLPRAEKAGYAFLGWAERHNSHRVFTTMTFMRDTVLYAQWRVHVEEESLFEAKTVEITRNIEFSAKKQGNLLQTPKKNSILYNILERRGLSYAQKMD